MRVKILFDVVDDWHKNSTETVWAIANDDGTYSIENVPFFARDVSNQDVVSAKPMPEFKLANSDARVFEFCEVISRGGHSTYRVPPSVENFPDFPQNEFIAVVEKLKDLKCVVEMGQVGLLPLAAIDVPASVDADEIYSFLKSEESKGGVVFQLAHDGHPSE